MPNECYCYVQSPLQKRIKDRSSGHPYTRLRCVPPNNARRTSFNASPMAGYHSPLAKKLDTTRGQTARLNSHRHRLYYMLYKCGLGQQHGNTRDRTPTGIEPPIGRRRIVVGV